MNAAIEFRGITKRFPGAVALEDVSIAIAGGTCHALCGENGAGKSTLGKVLAGIVQPDEGVLLLDGVPVRFSKPTQALRAGVAMVHQELSFCENLSVAENLTLGRVPGRAGFVSRSLMRDRARAMLAAIEADVDVDRLVGDLTTGQQQMIQIAAALGRGARIVIFDEPTSSLSQHEAERLFAVISRLRSRGVTCIYVSHRMEEIFRLSNTVTVLRDGRHVATRPTDSLDEATLIQLMIGRRIDQYFPKHAETPRGPEMLAVERLSGPAGFRDVTFRVHAGEILGLAGLVGSGRSEIARAIFGIDPRSAGHVPAPRRARRPFEPPRRDPPRHWPGAGGSQASGARALDDRPREWRPGHSGSARPARVVDRRRRGACGRSLRSSAAHARRAAWIAGGRVVRR